MKSIVLVASLAMSFSLAVSAKEDVEDYCATADKSKVALKNTAFEPFTKDEAKRYEEVRVLAKNVLDEKDFHLSTAEIKDITTFCPKYNNLSSDDRENFFAHLIANIARYESSFKSSTAFTENNGNVSKGLLGISFPSLSTKYNDKGCDVVETDADLLVEKKNIQCGIGIIARWVEADKNLASGNSVGASRYWSTLRAPYKTCIEKLDKIVTVGKKNVIIEGIKKNYFSKCYK